MTQTSPNDKPSKRARKTSTATDQPQPQPARAKDRYLNQQTTRGKRFKPLKLHNGL